MNTRLSRIALALLLALAIGRADDWPQWRGPHRDGISTERGWTTDWPAEGPALLWEATVGIGFSSVAVAQGRLYTLGNTNETDTVWCFDAATGALKWRHSYACPLDPQYYEGGPGSTPTVDGNQVYTFGKRGQLLRFDAASGKVNWELTLTNVLGVWKPRWGFAGSPLVAGDRLILNAGAAGTALDKATGRVIWSSGTNAAGYATPVPITLDGTPCALIFAAKALVAVQLSDGHELWRVPWITKWDLNTADPVVAGDLVFVSSFDRSGTLFRLRGRQPPEVVYERKGVANHFNSCVLLDGLLYGIDGNSDAPPKDLRCVDLLTGQVKWAQEGFGLGSLIVADRKLIVLGDKGELVVAPAGGEGFKPLARAQVLGGKCWTAPVLANGRLYCRNAAGRLVCLNLKAP